MDTLFRITHSSNFNTSIQALMLIEQLATAKHLEVDRFYRTLYESLLDPRLVRSSKHTLYLNLLFRALRSDVNIKRVKAFVKRLLQIVALHEPPFICGVIYLVRELESTFPGLKALFTEPEQNDEDDEEVFRDVPEDGDSTAQSKDGNAPKTKPISEPYDGRKRDPEHSNAEKTCLWESVGSQHEELQGTELTSILDSLPRSFPPLGLHVCIPPPEQRENAPETRSRHSHSRPFLGSLRLSQCKNFSW